MSCLSDRPPKPDCSRCPRRESPRCCNGHSPVDVIGATSPARSRLLIAVYSAAAARVLLNRLRKRRLWHCADDSVHLLAALEDHHSGDRANAVIGGNVGGLVGVELDALELALVLLAELVDERSNHAAWPAPRRPEIHQHGLRRLQHRGAEVVVVHLRCRARSDPRAQGRGHRARHAHHGRADAAAGDSGLEGGLGGEGHGASLVLRRRSALKGCAFPDIVGPAV
eukprot:231191-Chlamydomonas_euryale.AAC.9